MTRQLIALVIPFLFARAVVAQDFYGMTQLHEFHLELTAKEWERMQKVSGGPTFFAPKKPIAKDGEEPFEWHKSPGFGLEFPWAHADMTADGKSFKNVGLRYKGNGSYTASGTALKRNLKIEVDHYDKDQRAFGLRTITMNANSVDASRIREAIGYQIYRNAKVPAPRTGFAIVMLTVPGKFDRECLGVYTLVEHVDKVFLKTHFMQNDGLLMKPERMRGVEYVGDDWSKYKNRFFPKRDATPAESERLIALAKLISKSDDDTFKKEIGDYLDLDNFLRFLAVTTMLPNTDSFMTTGHNYYLYLHPKTNKLNFMPWDLDIAFAGFPMMGSVAEQTNMNLLKPGKLKLVDRLLAIPDVNAQYRKLVTEIATTAFDKTKLLADIDAMAKVLTEPIGREKKAKEARQEKADKFGAWIGGFFDPQPDLRVFIERRADAVAAQVKAMK